MFKIDDHPKFWATVKVRLGEEPEQTFKARFLARKASDWSEDKAADKQTAEDFLKEVLVDWDDVADEDGKAVKFSDVARDRLLDLPHARTGLVRAYFDGLTGAARGN